MTIADLIEQLRALPGDNSIRPVVVTVKLRRNLGNGDIATLDLCDVGIDGNVVRANATIREVERDAFTWVGEGR